MFKASVIPVLVFFAGHIQTETKLNLFSGDDKVGVGTYRETIDHKGHRTSEFHIWSTGDSGTKIAITQIKVIDSQGFPIREEEYKVEQAGGKRTEEVLIVKYEDSGAALLSERIGKTQFTPRICMPVPGYSRADASDLWFSKTYPLPGTTVTSTVFDIEHAKWQIVETTFIGKKWITVDGRQIEANEVRDIRDGNVRRVYLDDKGQPVLMKNGAMRTEKHF